MKPKTCKVCRAKFSPQRPLQSVCSPECSITIVTLRRNKAERQEALESKKVIRLKKEQLKTRSQWMKEAQSAFNAYIRERDKHQTCICCGKPLVSDAVGGGYDCGHYRSVGSAPHLRFNENNAHGQTKQCNRYGAGRAVDYRIGLLKRIGLKAVEELESDNTPKKYSINELKEIKSTYKLKLKQLAKGQ